MQLPLLQKLSSLVAFSARIRRFLAKSRGGQADFFQVRYGSTYLGAFVSLIGVLCLIPYVQVQLTGLGLIVELRAMG